MTGDATALAATLIRQKMGNPEYPVTIVAGAMGDVNLVDADLEVPLMRYHRGHRDKLAELKVGYVKELTHRAARVLGEKLVEAIDESFSVCSTHTRFISVWYIIFFIF